MMRKLLLVFAAFFIVKANAQQLELVEDINLDGSGYSQFDSRPSEFKEFNGKLYFSARNPKSGQELFSYDGTDLELVADINPGADASGYNYNNSSPIKLTEFDNELYFFANQANDSSYLFNYDGISAPTIVVDLQTTVTDINKCELISFNNNLYYNTYDNLNNESKLWEFDGINAPTELLSISTLNSNYRYKAFQVFNGKLYFFINNHYNGYGTYYVYDGTNPPSAAPNCSNFNAFSGNSIVYDNKIYFVARTVAGTVGTELWSYDGINAATNITDINVGIQSSEISYLTVFNSKLYFSAYDNTNDRELWSYDGTSVSQVADINTSGQSYPRYLTVYNNKLHFSASDGINGFELYEYDGTSAPVIADEILLGAGGVVQYLAVFQSDLVFAGNDATIGEELYKFDGSNISLVANIYNGSSGSSVNYITEYKDKIYFRAFGNPETGVELWSYDGVSTTMVADIDTNHYSSGAAASSDPKHLIVFNDILYFKANDGSGVKTWKYDGVNAPTIESNILDNASLFFEFNNKLYYNGSDGISGNEIWEFDGINNSTLVADIEIGSAGSFPSEFTVLNNKVIFSAYTAANGNEIWEFDGTNSPILVSDIYNGTVGSNPSGFTVHDGNVYFSAQGDTIIGAELWVYDGTNAPILALDLIPGIASNGYGHSSYPSYLNIVNDKLVFAAYDTLFNFNLWEYDFVNTPVQLTDYNPASNSYQFASATEIDNELYYWADEGAGLGAELYKYDGTGVPVMFDEVNEGVGRSRDSNPSNLLKYDGAIYLSANDGILGSSFGSELYKIASCTIDVSVTENNATLTANETGANYQWIDCDNGNTAISGETNQIFTATQTGNYACVVTKGACEETTACKNIVISGIESIDLKNQITVYPNPSVDVLNIKSEIEIYSVNIYSVIGKKVQSETTTSFSIKALNQGIYFIEVLTAKGTMNTQVIKK